jgi:hypothetical protein
LSALYWASWHGNTEILRQALRYWSELEKKDNAYGITPPGMAPHKSTDG